MTFTLDHNSLRVGDVSIQFQRTLRIPDDGRSYPLPPGLGSFPLRRIDDYAERVPADWLEKGGVLLPMYQREAMWLSFRAPYWKPHALKVGIGKVCALTGERWSEELHTKGWRSKQDYVVMPEQPWLDGINDGSGMIRQFVAMPLGLGYTVEGQVTGEETFGGIQLKVVPPKPGRFRRPSTPGGLDGACPPPVACAAPAAPVQTMTGSIRGGAMGMGAGGKMKQKIYPDRYGLESWDLSAASRVFVHIVNSQVWQDITGEAPPACPISAKTYSQHGMPWFDLYDEHLPTLEASSTLKGVKSIKSMDQEKSTHALQDDTSVEVGHVKVLPKSSVRDGSW